MDKEIRNGKVEDGKGESPRRFVSPFIVESFDVCFGVDGKIDSISS